ncbi:uncharacterized protein LRP34_005457 [Phaethornis superciliosus]
MASSAWLMTLMPQSGPWQLRPRTSCRLRGTGRDQDGPGPSEGSTCGADQMGQGQFCCPPLPDAGGSGCAGVKVLVGRWCGELVPDLRAPGADGSMGSCSVSWASSAGAEFLKPPSRRSAGRLQSFSPFPQRPRAARFLRLSARPNKIPCGRLFGNGFTTSCPRGSRRLQPCWPGSVSPRGPRQLGTAGQGHS